jgi:hypothetical protein
LPKRQSFRKGLLVGLGNPKMVLFFVAFLPQFIDPAQGPAATQVLVLGAVFWLIGTVWDVGCAVASGSLGEWLRQRPYVHALQGRAEGTAYFGMAAWAALSGSRSRHQRTIPRGRSLAAKRVRWSPRRLMRQPATPASRCSSRMLRSALGSATAVP